MPHLLTEAEGKETKEDERHDRQPDVAPVAGDHPEHGEGRRKHGGARQRGKHHDQQRPTDHKSHPARAHEAERGRAKRDDVEPRNVGIAEQAGEPVAVPAVSDQGWSADRRHRAQQPAYEQTDKQGLGGRSGLHDASRE